MNLWLGLLVFAALCLTASLSLAAGYRRGYREGFDAGSDETLLLEKRAELDWWINAEKGIDRERLKMWESET
jgi:hypothetical protein